MSKVVKKVVGGVAGILLGKPKSPAPPPPPEVPAPPAPTRRQDTGAQIVLGSSSSKNQRVSGRGSGRSGGDSLGSLGRGSGINI